MKNLTLLFLLNILLTIPVFSQGISFFEGTWKEAMDKAKKEDKLLFVDAFAKWCGPCKAMAKNVFTQQKVGDYFNSNFINLKLDMEEADGITFGHKYPVSAYPTLYFIDGDGKVIKMVKGGQQPDGLINLGAEALKNVDRSGDFSAKYEAGERDYELVYKYVKALNQAGKPSLKISNEYLNSNPAITEEQKLLFILEAAVDADSRIFDKFLDEKSKILKLTDEKSYTSKAMKACDVAVQKAIDFESETILNDVLVKAKKAFPDDAEKYALKSKMKYYKSSKQSEIYLSAAKTLAKKSSKDIETLKYVVKDILLGFDNEKKLIELAADCMSDVYKMDDSFEHLGLYCNVLILKSEVQKAIEITSKAKEKAINKKEDTARFDGLINYLQSKKA